MVGITSKGARRRAEVLAAARHLLVTAGLDQFSLRGLADALDTKLANLQYYFPTRDDLLAAILEAESSADVATLAAPAGVDPAADLRRAVAALTSRWAAEQGSVYLPLGVLAHRHERFAALTAAIWARFYDALVPVIQRVAPDVSATEAHARAVLITSLLDGASVQPLPPTGPSSRRALEPRYADLALRIARDG